MNFVGTGRRLSQGDVGAAARMIDVPTAALLAVMEVEARGKGFDAQNRPIILFEPHRFYAELGPGKKRDQAVKAGLAYARWGTKPYPAGSNAQYARLTRAITIDRDAALKACSWGLPQILASNHLASGFATPVTMVEVFKAGELEQLQAMCRLIKTWGLDAAMRDFGREDLRGERAFAFRYNGKAYATHGYHTRIGAANTKHSAAGDVMTISSSSILRVGSKGEAVRSLQADLLTLGADTLIVDGRFGPLTEAAVRLVQAKLGVDVDGVVGPATKAVIEAALAKTNTKVEGAADTWADREEDEPVSMIEERPVSTGGPTSKATGGAVGASIPQALLLLAFKFGLIPAEVAADPETVILTAIVIGGFGGWLGAYFAPRNAGQGG